MNESRFPKIEVQLRLAQLDDLKNLWLWRNDPVTRQNSVSHDYITWARHVEWFHRVTSAPGFRLLIAESYGFPVGTVRYIANQEDTELSWTVAPEFRHQGFGLAIVKAAIAYDPGLVLVAKIMPHNKASLKIAESLGFVEERHVFPRDGSSFLPIILTRHPE